MDCWAISPMTEHGRDAFVASREGSWMTHRDVDSEPVEEESKD